MSATLYPMLLTPKLVEVIWGGRALVGTYGKPGEPDVPLGESWECWDENRVENGEHAGSTVGALRAQLGSALLGALDPHRIFPILTKFIDARSPLSVQVHPDDAYAQRVEHQPFGKTECWYVLEAEPGATLVLGWNRDTSRGEYLERVKTGALEDVLRSVPVQPGDVFHLPAGTLHAIGAGIVLYETQQASDLTYRIYDYGRVGSDGKPRRLDVDKAADVLDYRKATEGALRTVAYELDGLSRTALVADKRFVVERVVANAEPHAYDLEGMPLVVTALERPLELEAHGTAVVVAPYRTALIPAALDVVMIRSSDSRSAAALTAAPPLRAQSMAARFARAAVPVAQSTGFLAQFP
ncbi:MAG: class I mannose-6-phosphate isomerase [Candidatus Eremiobacteraeota bacterium]|nr:class I mannose-6-phosphate isomerase [Candidatus Eremiobacteraeota bacterium]